MSWQTYLQDVKVLIADDQDFLRSIMRQLLGVLGCKNVVEASTATKAWNIILTTPIDIVIVDWEMGDIDGLELVDRIRNDKNTPDRFLPIIMLTAHSEHPRIAAARDAGVNEFMTKPISAKTLFAHLTQVIERPRRFIKTDDYFGPDRRRKTVAVQTERRTSDAASVKAPNVGKRPDAEAETTVA